MVGCLASIVGGMLVGLAYYIAILLSVTHTQLEQAPDQYLVIAVGALAGAVGSTVDSILGAIMQFSGK